MRDQTAAAIQELCLCGSDYIRERRKKIESMIEMWIRIGDRSWDDLLPLSFNIELTQSCSCSNQVGQVARIERFGTSLEKSESAQSYNLGGSKC